MKKIDRLLITNFIPPFLVTFGIATFVLLMQIDYTQGYYYAKPMVEEDVYTFIENNK